MDAQGFATTADITQKLITDYPEKNRVFVKDHRTGVLHDVKTPEGHVILAQRLKSAREIAYEASMMDYSMESINRATEDVQEAVKAMEAAGYEVPKW